jgi:hypothetical protein
MDLGKNDDDTAIRLKVYVETSIPSYLGLHNPRLVTPLEFLDEERL